MEIEAQIGSLYVLINEQQNKMILKGNSYILNPLTFYKDIINWGKTFKVKNGIFMIELTLAYCSTASIQMLNTLFKTLFTNNPEKIEIIFFMDEEYKEELEEMMFSITHNTGITPKIK